MKSITLPQALVFVGCLAALIASYKFLGSPEATVVTATVGLVINFLLGRGGPPADPPQDPPASKGPGLKAIGFTGAAMALCLLCFSGCALFTSQNAKSALDVLQVACIIANAESSDATVAQVCGVADVLIPDLQKILSEQRKALAKAKKEAACKKAAQK